MQGKAIERAIAGDTSCNAEPRGAPPDSGMSSVGFSSGDREAKIGEGTNGEVVEARSKKKCER